MGGCVNLLGDRKGQMLDLQVNPDGLSKIKYKIPTRYTSAQPCCCCRLVAACMELLASVPACQP